jgi:hypothetical protein
LRTWTSIEGDLHHWHLAVLRTVIHRPRRRPVLGDSRPGHSVVWTLATPNIEGSLNIEGPDIKLFIHVAGQTSILIIFDIDSEMNIVPDIEVTYSSLYDQNSSYMCSVHIKPDVLVRYSIGSFIRFQSRSLLLHCHRYLPRQWMRTSLLRMATQQLRLLHRQPERKKPCMHLSQHHIHTTVSFSEVGMHGLGHGWGWTMLA